MHKDVPAMGARTRVNASVVLSGTHVGLSLSSMHLSSFHACYCAIMSDILHGCKTP